MIKTKTLCLISVFITIFTSSIFANGFATIEGVWKHVSKPAYIEFNLESGIARVKEHQTHKENSGLTIIKSIVKSKSSGTEWLGEMFDGYQDKYVPVTIKLSDETVSVFDSQNNEVLTLIKQ